MNILHNQTNNTFHGNLTITTFNTAITLNNINLLNIYQINTTDKAELDPNNPVIDLNNNLIGNKVNKSRLSILSSYINVQEKIKKLL